MEQYYKVVSIHTLSHCPVHNTVIASGYRIKTMGFEYTHQILTTGKTPEIPGFFPQLTLRVIRINKLNIISLLPPLPSTSLPALYAIQLGAVMGVLLTINVYADSIRYNGVLQLKCHFSIFA